MLEFFRRPAPCDDRIEPASNEAANAEAGSGEVGADGAQRGEPRSRAEQARCDLLEAIVNFICQHDLRVTPGNLALVASALSGADRELSGAFAAREMAGNPIDQRWLDTLDRLNPASERRTAELEQLVEKIDDALMRFGQSARFAQSETSDHRGAIDAQLHVISQTGAGSSSRAEIDRLLDLSRALLGRLDQIEQALERSRMETDELRRNLAEARLEADIDHLTGLPNRRAFERRFAMAASHARRSARHLSIAFCDVDHFKRINDRHGHDAGDRVLKIIAACLSEEAGDACFVARHGGEEFVLLLPGMDKAAALAKVDAMRAALAARTLINRTTGKPFGRVTFSAGIAEVTENVDDRSALTRADAALYRAKQEGRNRILAA